MARATQAIRTLAANDAERLSTAVLARSGPCGAAGPATMCVLRRDSHSSTTVPVNDPLTGALVVVAACVSVRVPGKTRPPPLAVSVAGS